MISISTRHSELKSGFPFQCYLPRWIFKSLTQLNRFFLQRVDFYCAPISGKSSITHWLGNGLKLQNQSIIWKMSKNTWFWFFWKENGTLQRVIILQKITRFSFLSTQLHLRQLLLLRMFRIRSRTRTVYYLDWKRLHHLAIV